MYTEHYTYAHIQVHAYIFNIFYAINYNHVVLVVGEYMNVLRGGCVVGDDQCF